MKRSVQGLCGKTWQATQLPLTQLNFSTRAAMAQRFQEEMWLKKISYLPSNPENPVFDDFPQYISVL